MPITQAQIQRAQSTQYAAAHDRSAQVRVVAGPGTGKSYTIEERARWLLSQQVAPEQVCAVSFTRASALDLRQRIQNYCIQNGQPMGVRVPVSTLHSLALRILRAAGLLSAYPSDPMVLDGWELASIFDAEFGNTRGLGRTRCKEIRLEHEAFWSTGHWGPPNYIPPNPPISLAERSDFSQFHTPRTQAYSCVLPGEIVRKCVDNMNAGTLHPVSLLNIQHLIVDEYQDLNPIDLQFIDLMAAQGITLFVAGDDDQSIYSFRYASPSGIQDFPARYPCAGLHALSDCFRCTPEVLAAGQAVIGANPANSRIHKNHVSPYATPSPPQSGVVYRWRFANGNTEARAVAESCRDLIQAGTNPREILILLTNTRTLGSALNTELGAAGVPFEPPKTEAFRDTKAGRLVLSIVRIVCDADDYVAHRVLLGLRRGVGIGTCDAVATAVIINNLNYRDIFYQSVPTGVFSGRALNAVNQARSVASQMATWQASETLLRRTGDINGIITTVLGAGEVQSWQAFASVVPQDATIGELRDFLWADTDEQQIALLQSIYDRLNQPFPTGKITPDRVRVLTMHGAKGLSANVVFVPGLEEEMLPGPWRQPYPGLVLEAARLLYVSVARARAACILSYAQNRVVNGQFGRQGPSRFCTQLGGAFTAKACRLSGQELQQVVQECATL